MFGTSVASSSSEIHMTIWQREFWFKYVCPSRGVEPDRRPKYEARRWMCARTFFNVVAAFWDKTKMLFLVKASVSLTPSAGRRLSADRQVLTSSPQRGQKWPRVSSAAVRFHGIWFLGRGPVGVCVFFFTFLCLFRTRETGSIPGVNPRR